MLAQRRSVVLPLLGIIVLVLIMLDPRAADRPNGVVSADQNVRIDAPVDGASVTGTIDVRVTVTVTDPDQIDFYRLYVGNGRSPSTMRPLGPPRTAPAEREVVAKLDTTLLMAGEATIELRLHPKAGDPVDTRVVVQVQVGPTPTRVLSGPVVVIPPVAVAPPLPATGGGAAVAQYPVVAVRDVELPQFAPVERTPIPIQRLTPEYIYDTLPSDPVQTDPIFNDLPATSIPLPTRSLLPIPR